MSGIGLGFPDQAAPPVIPLPHQFRIARKSARRGKIFGAILLPQSWCAWSAAAKGGHTAFSRYSSTGEDGNGRGVAQPFANSVHSFQGNPLTAHLLDQAGH